MIYGYVYRADVYCPNCILNSMRDCGWLVPRNIRDSEGVLDWWAERNNFDRDNESSFDSDTFPKVIESVDEMDVCCECGRDLNEPAITDDPHRQHIHVDLGDVRAIPSRADDIAATVAMQTTDPDQQRRRSPHRRLCNSIMRYSDEGSDPSDWVRWAQENLDLFVPRERAAELAARAADQDAEGVDITTITAEIIRVVRKEGEHD